MYVMYVCIYSCDSIWKREIYHHSSSTSQKDGEMASPHLLPVLFFAKPGSLLLKYSAWH